MHAVVGRCALLLLLVFQLLCRITAFGVIVGNKADSSKPDIDGANGVICMLRDVDTGACVDQWTAQPQVIPTVGARKMKVFHIGDDIFLAIVSYYSGTSYQVNSYIHRWNATGGRFEQFQAITTIGALDCDNITIGNEIFLMFTNFYNGGTYNLNSVIYRWNAAVRLFEVFQNIPTNGAGEVKGFKIGNDTYFAVTNYYNAPTYTVPLNIYRWNALLRKFETFQNIAATGARAVGVFTAGNDTFLAIGHYYSPSYATTSTVHKWNAATSKFELLQSISTLGCVYVGGFSIGNLTFLAMSHFYNGVTYNIYSNLYVWNANANRFDLFQQFATSGAYRMEPFIDGNDFFLGIAHYQNGATHSLQSPIYRWSSALLRFELFQTIPTIGAIGMEFFTIGRARYLAVQHLYNGAVYSLDSMIYRFSALVPISYNTSHMSAYVAVGNAINTPCLFTSTAPNPTTRFEQALAAGYQFQMNATEDDRVLTITCNSHSELLFWPPDAVPSCARTAVLRCGYTLPTVAQTPLHWTLGINLLNMTNPTRPPLYPLIQVQTDPMVLGQPLSVQKITHAGTTADWITFLIAGRGWLSNRIALRIVATLDGVDCVSDDGVVSAAIAYARCPFHAWAQQRLQIIVGSQRTSRQVYSMPEIAAQPHAVSWGDYLVVSAPSINLLSDIRVDLRSQTSSEVVACAMPRGIEADAALCTLRMVPAIQKDTTFGVWVSAAGMPFQNTLASILLTVPTLTPITLHRCAGDEVTLRLPHRRPRAIDLILSNVSASQSATLDTVLVWLDSTPCKSPAYLDDFTVKCTLPYTFSGLHAMVIVEVGGLFNVTFHNPESAVKQAALTLHPSQLAQVILPVHASSNGKVNVSVAARTACMQCSNGYRRSTVLSMRIGGVPCGAVTCAGTQAEVICQDWDWRALNWSNADMPKVYVNTPALVPLPLEATLADGLLTCPDCVLVATRPEVVTVQPLVGVSAGSIITLVVLHAFNLNGSGAVTVYVGDQACKVTQSFMLSTPGASRITCAAPDAPLLTPSFPLAPVSVINAVGAVSTEAIFIKYTTDLAAAWDGGVDAFVSLPSDAVDGRLAYVVPSPAMYVATRERTSCGLVVVSASMRCVVDRTVLWSAPSGFGIVAGATATVSGDAFVTHAVFDKVAIRGPSGCNINMSATCTDETGRSITTGSTWTANLPSWVLLWEAMDEVVVTPTMLQPQVATLSMIPPPVIDEAVIASNLSLRVPSNWVSCFCLLAGTNGVSLPGAVPLQQLPTTKRGGLAIVDSDLGTVQALDAITYLVECPVMDTSKAVLAGRYELQAECTWMATGERWRTNTKPIRIVDTGIVIGPEETILLGNQLAAVPLSIRASIGLPSVALPPNARVGVCQVQTANSSNPQAALLPAVLTARYTLYGNGSTYPDAAAFGMRGAPGSELFAMISCLLWNTQEVYSNAVRARLVDASIAVEPMQIVLLANQVAEASLEIKAAVRPSNSALVPKAQLGVCQLEVVNASSSATNLLQRVAAARYILYADGSTSPGRAALGVQGPQAATLFAVVACTLWEEYTVYSKPIEIRTRQVEVRAVPGTLPSSYIPSDPAVPWPMTPRISLLMIATDSGSTDTPLPGAECVLTTRTPGVALHTPATQGDSGGDPTLSRLAAVTDALGIADLPDVAVQSTFGILSVNVVATCTGNAGQGFATLQFTIVPNYMEVTLCNAPPATVPQLSTVETFSLGIRTDADAEASSLIPCSLPSAISLPHISCAVSVDTSTNINATASVFLQQSFAIMDSGSHVAVFSRFAITGTPGITYMFLANCFIGTVVIPSTVRFSIAILGCPAGMMGMGYSCSPCPVNQFSIGGSDATCLLCPATGATCDGGILRLLPQYYRPPNQMHQPIGPNTELHPCFNAEACTLNASQAMYGCAEGYSGPLCSVCDAYTGFARFGESCAQCWAPGISAAVVGIAIFSVLALLALIAIRGSSNTRSAASIVLRITFSFVQAVGSLRAFSAGRTEAFRAVFGWTETLSTSPLTSGVFDCVFRLRFLSQYLLVLFVPLLATAMAVLIFVGWVTVQSVTFDSWLGFARQKCQLRLRKWLQERHFIAIMLLVLFLAYMPISSISLTALRCHERPIGGVTYLVADMRETCYVSSHLLTSIIAACTLVMITLGFPLGLAWLLLWTPSERFADKSFHAIWGFLYDGYRVGPADTPKLLDRSKKRWYNNPRCSVPHAVLWESVCLIRKAGIVFFAVLVTNPYGQSAGATLWLGLHLLLHIHVKPYTRDLFNHLEALSLVVSTITACASSVLLQNDSISGRTLSGLHVPLTELQFGVTLTIIALNVLTMAILVITWVVLQCSRMGYIVQRRSALISRKSLAIASQGRSRGIDMLTHTPATTAEESKKVGAPESWFDNPFKGEDSGVIAAVSLVPNHSKSSVNRVHHSRLSMMPTAVATP